MFRMLWWIDSTKKSDPDEPDPSEVSDTEVDAYFNESAGPLLRCAVGNGMRHSGRVMMPTTASRYTGRSVPEIDWLCFPLSISSIPTHHLLRMFTRRSKSSGLRFLHDA